MSVWLVDLLIRGAFVCLLGGLASALARRQAASVRALAWSATLVALLALPVVAWLFPSFDLPVLAAAAPAPVEQAGPAVQVEVLRSERETPVAVPTGVLARALTASGGSRAVPVAAKSSSPPEIGALLVGLWLAVAGVLIARVLLGVVATLRLRAGAISLSATSVADQLSEIAARLDMHAAPALLASEYLDVPIAAHFVRPSIIVPVDFVHWPRQRRAAVLLHETMHLRRYDCWLQLAARVAVALHWVNPLAWLALSRLWLERERACDDAVLRSGVRPSEYATHLLHVAADTRSLPAHAATAFIRRQQLPDRVRAILNPNADRQSPPRRSLVSATAVFLVAALPIALAQPVAARSAEPASVGEPAANARHLPSPTPAPAVTQQAMPSIDDLVRMRIHGVTPAFIEAMSELVDELDIDTLVRLRIHGVTPDYARDMRAAFGERLSLQDLAQGRIHGVTPEFASGMAAGLGDVSSFETLTQMRIHGVSLQFLHEVQELLPYEEIEADELVRMRIHGVSPKMIRELNDRGYDDLTIEELVRIKIHGFDRVMRRRSGDQR